jgi:hypothetical protein
MTFVVFTLRVNSVGFVIFSVLWQFLYRDFGAVEGQERSRKNPWNEHAREKHINY